MGPKAKKRAKAPKKQKKTRAGKRKNRKAVATAPTRLTDPLVLEARRMLATAALKLIDNPKETLEAGVIMARLGRTLVNSSEGRAALAKAAASSPLVLNIAAEMQARLADVVVRALVGNEETQKE